MKIIKQPPKQQSEYPKKIECLNCKAILEIEESDLIQIEEYDQRHGEYRVKGVNCPCCNKPTKLNKFSNPII